MAPLQPCHFCALSLQGGRSQDFCTVSLNQSGEMDLLLVSFYWKACLNPQATRLQAMRTRCSAVIPMKDGILLPPELVPCNGKPCSKHDFRA